MSEKTQKEKAEKIIKEIYRVGDYLCLWDDHEFDELRELLEKYDEAARSTPRSCGNMGTTPSRTWKRPSRSRPGHPIFP